MVRHATSADHQANGHATPTLVGVISGYRHVDAERSSAAPVDGDLVAAKVPPVFLSISTTHRPATDLGFLLHKNPSAVRSVALTFGTAHVLYPEASDDRCTVALLVEVDPIPLARGRRGAVSPVPYVNDRSYAASSFLSVALAKVFGTAMSGRSDDRPELAVSEIPLEIRVPALACARDPGDVEALFEPLGYEVRATPIALDERFPGWGRAPYVDATLTVTARLADVLSHLYVLLPVLDDQKHYWVTRDEIDKLLRRGGDWLATHPARETIAHRYLRHRPAYTTEALARLLEEDAADPDAEGNERDREEARVERPIALRDRRIEAVTAALREANATSVLDLGCGDGRLLEALLRDGAFTRIVGVDVSHAALERAARRLHLDDASPKLRERVELLQGSLTYRDRRLEGFDAAVLMEVVEHLDPERLPALERSVFGAASPRTIVVTTPNAEYNVRFERLDGPVRHRDHRFEWTREEFRGWAERTASVFGYGVRFAPVGDEDREVGPPTQMAVFSR
jgi:3' terminal RNA ribose 2'-O-methyltransferase Hen1